jgi:signal transduction histidine kinase
MMRRVLGNLVKNAVEAQQEQSSVARVHVKGQLHNKAIVISIDDDGPGIDDTVLARLFEPYVTTKRGGTGLGLAIVKKIVLQHGARIEASRSQELTGARFQITIPRSHNKV